MEIQDKIETITLINPITQAVEVWNPYTGEMVATSVDKELEEMKYKGFTLERAQAIVSLVREGYSFRKIEKMANMPSVHIMYFWKRKFPNFAKMLKEAREDRADLLVERYLEMVESDEDISESEARAIKNKIDAWKWVAEKYSPKEFGVSKERGDGAPTQINIYTGIIRDEEPETTVTINGEKVGG
jgi:transposase